MLKQSSCCWVYVLSRRSSYCHSSPHLWMRLVAIFPLKWCDVLALLYLDVRSKRHQSFFEQPRTESAAGRLSQELFRIRTLAWEGREMLWVLEEISMYFSVAGESRCPRALLIFQANRSDCLIDRVTRFNVAGKHSLSVNFTGKSLFCPSIRLNNVLWTVFSGLDCKFYI